MKKVLILAALSLLMPAAFAQKSNVKAAEKLASSNVAEARRLASEARQHDESKGDAYTWFVSGNIESGVFKQELLKEQLTQGSADLAAMYGALMAEVPMFLEVYRIESQPDAKGKVKLKYAKKVADILRDDAPLLINAGYYYIQGEDYARSTDAFVNYLDVYHHPLFAEDKIMQAAGAESAAEAAYLALAASYEGKLYDRTIEYGNRYKGQEHKRSEIYQLLSAAYLAKGDTIGAMPVLEEGAKLFPKEMYFLGNIVNITATQGKTDEAIRFLQTGIAQDSTNVNFITALGGLYERKEDFKASEEAYLRAYDMDKASFDTNYNLGRIYFNEGLRLRNVENLDKLTQEQAVAMFRKAIPYLEVAYKADQTQVYYTLASAFAAIGDETKYDEIMKANQ